MEKALIQFVKKMLRCSAIVEDRGGGSGSPPPWHAVPSIAVVGLQESGKSSVLESVLGRDFLPRGSGIVTRRPIVVQLHMTEAGMEFAEFAHLPRRFYNFAISICLVFLYYIWYSCPSVHLQSLMVDIHFNSADVRKEISDETNRDGQISSVPIYLSIYSPNVVEMVLVDLPGLPNVATGGQAAISKEIEDIIRSYIKNPKCVILCVCSADQLTSNGLRALKISQNVDPSGKRIFGVLTKIDLVMDKETTLKILEGKLHTLLYPWLGVANRSQVDIQNDVGVGASWLRERQYFAQSLEYGHMAKSLGSQHLGELMIKLNSEKIDLMPPSSPWPPERPLSDEDDTAHRAQKRHTTRKHRPELRPGMNRCRKSKSKSNYDR